MVGIISRFHLFFICLYIHLYNMNKFCLWHEYWNKSLQTFAVIYSASKNSFKHLYFGLLVFKLDGAKSICQICGISVISLYWFIRLSHFCTSYWSDYFNIAEGKLALFLYILCHLLYHKLDKLLQYRCITQRRFSMRCVI